MIKAFSVALLIMSASLLFIFDEAAAAFSNWKAFNDDYIDTDEDGEKDDYKSYDIDQRFKLFDTLVDYETILTQGYTILTLKSDPANKVIFGNVLDRDVMRGKAIILDVQIVSDKEFDGDDMEIYDILSIYVTEASGSGDEDSGSDTLSSILAVALCCGPQIAIPVIIAIVVIHQQNKKKKAAEAKIWSEGAQEAPPQTPATSPLVPQQPPPVQPLHSRTGNLWNEKELSHGQPRILEPPPDRTADQAQQAANDDMSGLDDFMKGIQSEGSDADFVLKEDALEKTIPRSEGEPPPNP
jgi:hypothetical protein